MFPLSFGNKQFTWSGGRNLASITEGTNTYSYAYNKYGFRTSKTVNGLTTDFNVAEDGAIVSQTDGTNTFFFEYSEDNTPLGFVLNNTQYLYITNNSGDVMAIADSTGNIIATYSYNEWGVPTVQATGDYITLANLNPIRYRGYYYDSETGYYYLQSRYYDPEICRFINADLPDYAKEQKNEAAGINVFVYCCNDAVNNSDGLGCAVNKNDTNVKISDFIKKHNLVQTSFNCFSYAVGIYNKHTNIPKFNEKSTINDCKIHTIDWLKKHKYRVNDVTNSGGCNYQTKGHTWLIALRIGSFTIGANTYYDFHFMKRSNVDKTWSFKGGKVGNVYNLKSGKNPNNSNWNIYYLNKTKIQYEKVYRSKIIYLAITN